MHTRFSNPLLALAAGSNLASMEARFLRKQFNDAQEALNYATSRKQVAINSNNQDSEKFWSEVELCLQNNDKKENGLTDLIPLITYVDNFTPQDKWIIPILDSITYKDFHTQLLTAIEDHDGTI